MRSSRSAPAPHGASPLFVAPRRALLLLPLLLGAALPAMQALARDTRQSNHLVVHHDRRILVIASVASPEAMGFVVRQGMAPRPISSILDELSTAFAVLATIFET